MRSRGFRLFALACLVLFGSHHRYHVLVKVEAFVSSRSVIVAFSTSCSTRRPQSDICLSRENENDGDDTNNDEDDTTASVDIDKRTFSIRGVASSSSSSRRRVLLQSSAAAVLSCSVPFPPQPSFAGPVGAKINEVITKSDLGIAVRQSVVRGAQTMDKVDGQWEQFSDRFGLGAARKKQPSYNKPSSVVVFKKLPDQPPLDTDIAKRILQLSDETFVRLTRIPSTTLSKHVTEVANRVRPSFERSSSDNNMNNGSQQGRRRTERTTTEQQQQQANFNFDSYTHYKAYGDLISMTSTKTSSSSNISFNTFRTDFERAMGQQLLNLLLPNFNNKNDASTAAIVGSTSTTRDNGNSKQALQQQLTLVDQACNVLIDRGLVAATERSVIEEEQLEDWTDDLVDLTFTVAIDGDITMNAQILLQEQGLRLYPNYAKYMIATVLQPQQPDADGSNNNRMAKSQTPPQWRVTVDDYYFDTDYNSDPNRFEPKQVVLNIVLESA